MVAIQMVLDGEGIPEMAEKAAAGKVIHLGNGTQFTISALTEGTESGKPSIAFIFDLPDGRAVLAETTLALFLTVADSLRAKFGDPRR